MLKKLLAFLCAAILLGSGALAQGTTMVENFQIEGMEESRTVTLFESMYGYTLWYDAAKLSYIAPGEGNNVDTFAPLGVTGVDATFSVVMGGQALDYTLENAVADQKQTLEESGFRFIYEENGVVTGLNDTRFIEVRIVETPRGLYYLTSCYPLEMADGWGARFAQMANSFVAQPALRLSFENDVPFIQGATKLTVNEGGETALLWTDETLTNLSLYSVTAGHDGFTKDRQLMNAGVFKAMTDGVLLTVNFPEGIPNLMAEYTDSVGKTHTVLLTQSLRDSRLMTILLDEK